jgi:hypothetical protein
MTLTRILTWVVTKRSRTITNTAICRSDQVVPERLEPFEMPLKCPRRDRGEFDDFNSLLPVRALQRVMP